MSILDKIALDHIDLIKGEMFPCDGDEVRSVLSKTFEIAENDESFEKQASDVSPMCRILQACDVNMHQDDDVPDIWQAKQGNIVRTTPLLIKG
jgi:hypothetical protein